GCRPGRRSGTRPPWAGGVASQRAAGSPPGRADTGWRSAPAGWPGPASLLLHDHAERIIRPGWHPRQGPSQAGAGTRGVARLAWVAVRAGRRRHVVDGEGAFAAHVAGEGEPPAQDGADAVAVAGEEADVDEQPGQPAEEAAEVQPEGRDDGPPPRDVGGRPQVPVPERLVMGLALGLVADLVARVQPRLHRDLGDPGQLVQAHHIP